jgi:hypothetical protein
MGNSKVLIMKAGSTDDFLTAVSELSLYRNQKDDFNL